MLGTAKRKIKDSTVGRMYRRAVSPEFRMITETAQEILSAIPQPRFDAIRDRFLVEDPAAENARIVHISSRKYLNAQQWLENAVERAMHLGLHEAAPKSVLDLGCGAGWFLQTARNFGHQVMGLDLGENRMYNELIELFELERAVHCIDPFVKLPEFGRKFDLVTGYMVYFNFYNFEVRDARAWGADEWTFFLEDVRGYLNPGGQLYLQLNRGGPYLPEGERFEYLTDVTAAALKQVPGVEISADKAILSLHA